MKAVLSVVLIVAVLSSSVRAFTWDDFTALIAKMPLTAEEAHQHGHKVIKSDRIDHEFELASRRSYERRLSLGLLKASSTASPVTNSGNNVDTTQMGAAGWALGFSYGLQNNPQAPGKCYSALQVMITDLSALSSILSTIYLPSNWANLALDARDLTAMTAAIYAHCDVQKLFNTLTSLVSTEGLSTLASRVGGGLIFELPAQWNKFQAATSDFIAG